MKKLLSILLALSMCLSCVLLLASCTGKSAYEVAVENGFEGDEKAWLESLKGPTGEAGKTGKKGDDGMDAENGFDGIVGDDAYQTAKKAGFEGSLMEWLNYVIGKDGADGKTPVVTVNEDGYWVIDGIPTTTMVDGKKYTVTDLELVEDTFTILIGDAEEPDLAIKYISTSEDGTSTVEKIVPINKDNISPAIDFRTGGEQEVTISYAGFEKKTTVTIESLMVLYQNFDTLNNASTMTEILATTGFKIPTIGPDNSLWTETIYTDLQGNPINAETFAFYYNPAGEDLSPYTLPGYRNSGNFFNLKVEDGKMYIGYVRAKDYIQPTVEADKMTSCCLVLADDKQLALAGTGAYTVQMDLIFHPDGKTYKNDSTAQHIDVIINRDVDYEYHDYNGEYDGASIHTGITFGLKNRVSASYSTRWTWSPSRAHNRALPYLGKSDGSEAAFMEHLASDEGGISVDVVDKLFPNQGVDNWYEYPVTIRIVVKETVETEDGYDFGYDLYMKKQGDPDSAFVYMCSYNMANQRNNSPKNEGYEKTIVTPGYESYVNGEAFLALNNTGTHKRSGYWIDNVAVWIGTGDMPEITDTYTYQALNDEYLASLATPAN